LAATSAAVPLSPVSACSTSAVVPSSSAFIADPLPAFFFSCILRLRSDQSEGKRSRVEDLRLLPVGGSSEIVEVLRDEESP
jgi:hypothetical protein